MEKNDKPLELKELYSLDSFYVSPIYKPYLEGICFSDGMINSRTEKLAWNIADFYNDRPYTMITLMKGAIHFSSVLIKRLKNIYKSGIYKNSIRNEFIKVKRVMIDNIKKVIINGLENINIEGKDILLIEDVIDSGISLVSLIENLLKMNPKSIKICAMIKKKKSYSFDIDFLGINFDSENKNYCFVGYGLDYREFFRDFPHLAALNELGLKTFDNFKE